MRGFDGHELWKAPTRSVVMHHNCIGLDVNEDGIDDCILTGKHASCQAVDRKTGKCYGILLYYEESKCFLNQ